MKLLRLSALLPNEEMKTCPGYLTYAATEPFRGRTAVCVKCVCDVTRSPVLPRPLITDF